MSAFEVSSNRVVLNTATDVKPHIVGGTNGRISTWPWMSLVTTTTAVPLCAATLIQPDYVITSAQCITYIYPSVLIYSHLT